jgi:ribosomal subunit interface protein
MKVTYTGRKIDLSPEQTQKLEAEFVKVGKLLDNGRGEAEARVVLSHERHQNVNSVEVTVPYHNHELVGEASDVDLFTALHAAVGKLESQAIKLRAKWRDSKRGPRPDASELTETDGQSVG